MKPQHRDPESVIVLLILLIAGVSLACGWIIAEVCGAESNWGAAWAVESPHSNVWHLEHREPGGVFSKAAPSQATGPRELPERVLVFTAAWCGPCRQNEATWTVLRSLRSSPWDIAARPDAHFELIDFDSDDRRKSFHITSIPTLIKLDRAGREVRRWTGPVSPTQATDFWLGSGQWSAPTATKPTPTLFGLRWTWPGDGSRESLIEHLSTAHGYQRPWLSLQSDEYLQWLHADSHGTRR